MSQANCTELTDVCTFEVSVYGYQPSLPANAALLAIFALFAIASVVLGVRYKTWTYMIAVSLGCLAEAIGYVGRLIMRDNPFADGGFITQICCLIIAPAFNSAAIYLVLKHVVLCFGESSSYIRARFYTYIFIAFDILSLVLQGAGGGIASTADEEAMRDVGDGLIMAGIAWQVAALSMFAIAAGVYVLRRRRAIPREPLSEEAVATLNDTKFRLFIAGVFTAWFTIYIRCVYRIVEMAGGWGNSVMRHESSFIVLEGVMIVIAAGCQTILHPGWGFPRLSGWGDNRATTYIKSSEETSMEELRAR
ncbi:hypothetical protein B0A52_00952 [Exophiala mesophila]|uniref:Sphingoid long-chain base transporter RSB1 n=1 Tax=Exophiala mesophila TaxID=212818 RepID=A0A438NIP4_EXOME|nr:hypothetical protein B0A52_00952 [Exophiala mesophila]